MALLRLPPGHLGSVTLYLIGKNGLVSCPMECHFCFLPGHQQNLPSHSLGLALYALRSPRNLFLPVHRAMPG